MVVVIPHETEELKLIKLQKELSAKLFQAGIISVSGYPFWIELPVYSVPSGCSPVYSVPSGFNTVSSVPTGCYLKEIAATFSKLTVQNPHLENNQLLLELVYTQTTSQTESETSVSVKFPLLTILRNPNNIPDKKITAILDDCNLFPMNLKIFQLAQAKKIPGGKQILQGDSVYVKLKIKN